MMKNQTSVVEILTVTLVMVVIPIFMEPVEIHLMQLTN